MGLRTIKVWPLWSLYQLWKKFLVFSLPTHPEKGNVGEILLSLSCNLTLPTGILPFLCFIFPNLVKALGSQESGFKASLGQENKVAARANS